MRTEGFTNVLRDLYINDSTKKSVCIHTHNNKYFLCTLKNYFVESYSYKSRKTFVNPSARPQKYQDIEGPIIPTSFGLDFQTFQFDPNQSDTER